MSRYCIPSNQNLSRTAFLVPWGTIVTAKPLKRWSAPPFCRSAPPALLCLLTWQTWPDWHKNLYTNYIRICIQIVWEFVYKLYKNLYTNYIQICIQSPLLHSSTSGCSCYWFKHDLHQFVNNLYIIWKPFVTKSRQAVNKLNRENAKQQPKTITGPLNIILTEHDERSSY